MPLGRRGFGLSGPAWLGWHCWGLGAEGLRTPNPASPRRRTHWEWVSGSGEPQQSSRAQGARGSPAPLCPMESGGPAAKTACGAFLREAGWGCGFLPEESFPLQNVAARSSFWAVGVTGPRRCVAEVAQGAWMGPWRRRPSGPQSCFPTKEELCVVGFGHRRPPAKQQVPTSLGSPTPLCPMESGGPGRKWLTFFSGSEALSGCGLMPEESFPLQNAAPRSSLWAAGVTGPRR